MNILHGRKLILSNPNNGIDSDEVSAVWSLIERYGPNPEFTVKDIHPDAYSVYVEFEEIGGRWNATFFREK